MRIRDIRKNNKMQYQKFGVVVLGIAGVVFKKYGRGYRVCVVADVTDPAVEEVGFVVKRGGYTLRFVTQDNEVYMVDRAYGGGGGYNNAYIPAVQDGLFAGEKEEILKAIKEWSDSEHADT